MLQVIMNATNLQLHVLAYLVSVSIQLEKVDDKSTPSLYSGFMVTGHEPTIRQEIAKDPGQRQMVLSIACMAHHHLIRTTWTST